MAFGLNRAEVIGRLGADVTINHLASGGRVANLSIATDESYIDRQTGERVDRTEWHRIVTFQNGLVDMFDKHAKKGRLVYVAGKLQTRKWRKDGEESDRFSTEILLVPGGRVQFLDKPAGTNGNGTSARPTRRPRPPAASAPADGRRHPVLSRFLHPPCNSGSALRRRPHFFCCPLRARRRREAGAGRYRASSARSEESRHADPVLPSRRSRAMNAAAVAAALAERAEAVCRRYLPHGRRHGRYWVAGDLDGARGRSLYVRLAGPGKPGKWTDAATGEHGDLLDIIRHCSGAPTLRVALDEARAFLALPAAPAAGEADAYDATEAARRLWRRCRAIDGTHAEAYLMARGLARCRFAALRFHPALRYREGTCTRRLPALVAAVTGE